MGIPGTQLSGPWSEVSRSSRSLGVVCGSLGGSVLCGLELTADGLVHSTSLANV